VSPSSRFWTDVTLSKHMRERAALNLIRDRFPAREPFRAWATNKVDLSVASPTGFCLVETKPHPGQMVDDARGWLWRPPDNRPTHPMGNPVILADRKAERDLEVAVPLHDIESFLDENEDLVVGLDKAPRATWLDQESSPAPAPPKTAPHTLNLGHRHGPS